jgi:hypothetical protein
MRGPPTQAHAAVLGVPADIGVPATSVDGLTHPGAAPWWVTIAELALHVGRDA